MRRFLLLSLMAALALSAASCGSDKKSPFDPTVAEKIAQEGDAALVNSDLPGADAKYKDALAKDPGNGHANLGAAITSIGLLQGDASVDSLLTFLDGVPLPAPHARAARSSRLLAHMGLRPGVKYDPRTNGRRLAKLIMRSVSDPSQFSWVQGVIQDHVMPRLQYAEDRLNVIESHPTFTYLAPQSLTGLDFPLEIDLGEVLTLDAIVNSVQGVFGTLVAYNLDLDPDATDAQTLDPGNPFGTFNPGGAAILSGARADLLRASARIAQMDAFIRAEGDPQDDDAIPVEALDDPDFQSFEAGYADLEAALTGTISVDVDTWDDQVIPVDVAPGSFFTNPITDWKAVLPTHDFDGCDQLLVTNPITFPNQTFNGLFPGMTNALWQNIIGTVDPQVCLTRPF